MRLIFFFFELVEWE